EGRPGQLGSDDLAVPEGDERVRVARRDQHLAAGERGQGGDAVVRAEGVDEVGQRVHGVRTDHGVDQVDAGRVDAAVAVGEPAGQGPDQVVPHPAGALDQQRLPAGDEAETAGERV